MVTQLNTKIDIDIDSLQLTEKVVDIRRVAKVIKGGRHLSFTAMVVVGDGEGYVGAGLGKADAVPDAVRKGTAVARKSLMKIPLKGSTIPHEIRSRYGAAEVLLKPASTGTGIIAGGGIRAVVEQAGIKDILTKSLGSHNPINVVKATLKALSNLRTYEDTMALREEVKGNSSS
jgi:small subunit ribosomal protein S5|tara:strand:- start:675 stop:1196 length:522 start_codon:yes stop_codon:yes gene_type:complete